MQVAKNYRYLLIALLAALCVLWLMPVYNAVTASLMTHGWGNYEKVLGFKLKGQLFLPKMLINSVIVVGTSILLILLVSMLAAFAYSKMKFRGRHFFYLLTLGFFAVPVITILQPNTVILNYLGLRNTYLAMIIPMTTINIPIALLIFKNYFDGISNAFMEAAMIDGCTRLQTFIKLIIPISVPAIVNVLIVVFLNGWNDYVIPLMFNSKPELFTLTLAPGFFSTSMYSGEIGTLYASIIVIAVPTLLFYLFMQRYIIEGLTAGGIKE
ncbi:carbohydrate ABC transporter permease [Paenibacillus xerothermodurans]|uniref:Carbohydrate ABC transporter permease n=1 Tax=Paenibacillus xerothermodurans TaxID=1977292 RepID=A0A2W1N6K7_PAEXE|nr:carbohydrate ABC transporter permease [Paenibacillus xerothermodurans]PZE20027.1 carbohydrate ABC transporter permease [Paenibacillus xerothermodurans]